MSLETLSFTTVKNTTIPVLLEKTPFGITSNGTVELIVCRPEDVVLIKNLHPRVQIQIKALVAKAEQGNPSELQFNLPEKES